MAKKIPKQTATWRTKDGNRIRICDMDNNHLINVLLFLKSCAKKQYKEDKKDFDKSIIVEKEIWYTFTSSIFDKMELEAKRRGIENWEKISFYKYNSQNGQIGIIKENWGGIRGKIKHTNKFKLIKFD